MRYRTAVPAAIAVLSFALATATAVVHPSVALGADRLLAAADPAMGKEIRAWLTPGTHAATLFGPVPPPRFLEIYKKVQEAAQRDPEWWKQKTASAQPGQPLPYDPKMGITPEEYSEMLELGKQPVLGPVGQASFTVKREGGKLTLDGGQALPELTGIQVDPANATVTTKFGVLSQEQKLDPSKTQTPLGQITGYRWARQPTADSPGVAFLLGRFGDQPKGLIVYEMVQVGADGRPTGGGQYFMIYDLNR